MTSICNIGVAEGS